METELPAIMDEGYGGVRPETFFLLWDKLSQEGWIHEGFGVSRLIADAPDHCIKPTQMISTDTGPTIEIAPHPCLSLQEVEVQVTQLRQLVIAELAKRNVSLIGSGIHPVLGSSLSEYYQFRTPRGPYDYAIQERGWDHRTMLNIAATQEVIDVPFEDAITALRVMHRLAGIMLFLCRNDPDYHRSTGHRLSVRPKAWQCHVPGYGPFALDAHKVWLPGSEIRSWDDYLKLLWADTPMFILGTKNDGLVYVPEHPSFWQFLSATPPGGWKAKTVDQTKQVFIHPEMTHVMQTDWTYMGFARLRWKWHDDAVQVPELVDAFRKRRSEEFLRAHLKKVLLENRSSATAPPGEEMASLAFVTGLMANLHNVRDFVDRYSYAFWLAVAHAAEYKPMDVSIDHVSVIALAKDLLVLAENGLRSRGYHEETYLNPLKQRVEAKCSPSEAMLLLFEQHGLDAVVKHLRYS